jgi:hypothetical protein
MEATVQLWPWELFLAQWSRSDDERGLLGIRTRSFPLNLALYHFREKANFEGKVLPVHQ